MADREVKVIQVKNGYIVKFLDFTGDIRIFTGFGDMMDFLFDYFMETKT